MKKQNIATIFLLFLCIVNVYGQNNKFTLRGAI